jgi:hypothetical protein
MEPIPSSPSTASPAPVAAPAPWTHGRSVRTISLTVLLLAAMLFVWTLLQRALDIPGAVANAIPAAIEATSAAAGHATDRAAGSLKRLVQAINTQTIKTDYASTGTTLARTQYLQVGRINQIELFERRDSAKRLGVPMPDLIVSARAPIEYTYYLDLTGNWEFAFDGKRVQVIAPAIQFNKPAVDASAISYKVEEDSFLRNSAAAIDALKRSITRESEVRAKENIQLVRETARRGAEQFVSNFVVHMYGADKETPVSVVFRDETLPVAIQAKLQ